MAPPRNSSFLLEVTLVFSLEIMVLLQQIDYTFDQLHSHFILSLYFHAANILDIRQLKRQLADIR